MKEILVFVPGLLGSELHDEAGKVWPGDGWEAIRGFSDQHFARLMNPRLVPKSILRDAIGGIVPFYSDWIKRFESLRRMADDTRMFVEAEGTLICVPYDWRGPCEAAAERLSDVLEKIAATDANAKVHIVAHSLGGLVTRFYLQSGKYAGRPGLALVKTFVTFGTPHNGAPIALAAAKGLHTTYFLSREQSIKLANDPQFPSLYQTFPHPDHPLIWERHSGGMLKPHCLGERDFALEKLNLVEASYRSYLDFRTAIHGKPYPEGIRRFLLMGTRYPTMTHFFWTNDPGGALQVVSTLEGGDGTVSVPGAYLADVQCQLTGEAHVTLIKANEARGTFQELMGARGMLGAPQVDLSVRDAVVQRGAEIYLGVASDGTLDKVAGEIVFETAYEPAPGAPPQFVPLRGRAPKPFAYDGPAISAATLVLPGLDTPGVYRIAVQAVRGGPPIAESPPFAVSAA